MSSEPWKLPYSKLNYVAQMINNWYGVGLNLEILPNELDIIKANGEQKAFKMLRLWRDRNVSLFTENELKSILQHALEKMFPIEVEAIEELNNVANQDQVDVDASGDAFVTAVSGEGDIEPVPQAVDIRRI